MIRFAAAGLTDRGLGRSRNEDAFLVDQDLGLYAVSDGMGGHPGGDLASRTAIDALRAALEFLGCTPGALQRAFAQAHAEVRQAGYDAFPDEGIGATLTGVVQIGNTLHWGHAGDSALYRFRAGQLELLTEEHTLARLYRERGTEDASLPASFAHTLTLCLGLSEEFTPDFDELAVQPGDRFLLLTDGVTKVLEPRAIASRLNSTESLKTILQSLREDVYAAEAPDNLTLVLLEAIED